MKVREGVALLVLVDGGGGYASVNDLAKEATHSDTSVQDGVSLR
jgi:predicted Zn-dependent protease